MPFKMQNIPIGEPQNIENTSLKTIEKECQKYPQIKKFSNDEKEVIKRLLHASPVFDMIIPNIYFSKNAINKTKNILKEKGKIITDTNMIKTGLSSFYTKKYQNEIICYVNDKQIKEKAKKLKITRSYLAVEKAIIENKNNPLILACGNAPTFLYSAINTIVKNNIDINNIVFIAFPVGFVNVVDSKEYMQKFIEYYPKSDAFIMKGRFGGSTLVVSCLHSIYRLIT